MRDTACHAPRAAFTLLEVLVALGIITTTLVGFIGLGLFVLQSRNRAASVYELQANTDAALEIIARRVRTATAIDTAASSWGASPGVLVLRMADATRDPTTIRLSGSSLEMIEGDGDPVALTSTTVAVTRLVFTDAAAGGGTPSVRVEWMIAPVGGGSAGGSRGARTMQTAVTLRK